MNTIDELLDFLNLKHENETPIKGIDNKYYYTYLIIPTNPNSSFYLHVYFGMKISYSLKTDNYTGSGRKITRYINKYPNDYYKQYLGFYNDSEELCKAEYNLIHPHLNKEYCLNLKEGGGNAPLSIETRKRISEKLKNNIIPDEVKLKISKTIKQKFNTSEMKEKFSKISSGKNNPMYGKNAEDFMTPEAIKEKRRKQSEKMRGRHIPFNETFMTQEAIKEKRRKFSESFKGKNTWIKGKKHIHRDELHILVYPEELEKYLNDGWILGLPDSMKQQNKKWSSEQKEKVKGKNTWSKYLKYINKDGKTKRVKEQEIENYLKLGWKLGRGKLKK